MLNRFLNFLKRIVFPIERSELKLFIKMALLFICVLFNFSSLRTLKDSLVIPIIGAEAISFLKLWTVLPSAILFTFLYVKLSNHWNLDQIFSMFAFLFIGFLLIFAFVIYPNQHQYHTSPDLIDYLVNLWPHLKWFIKLFGKWSYVLVYILAEIWGAMMINLMFWQFANHIFKNYQAQRIYPMIGMFGSLGLILAGKFLGFVSDVESVNLNTFGLNISSYDQVELAIKLIVFSVSIVGLVAVLLFRNIYFHYIEHDELNKLLNKETKTSLGILESIRMIWNSRYIFYIFLLVISYGLTINILEGPWKAKLSQLYNNPCDYMRFMGNFNVWMGFSSVIMTIIGGNILRHLGWRVAAYITPIMITVTGTLFFGFVILGAKMDFGFDPLFAAVIVGATQNILSKSSKYSLFDSTKEMTYIPLSLELRTKGKASVEIIGSKIGKSLGAFLQFILFTALPDINFDGIAVFLMVIFLTVAVIWLIDVNKLSKEYQKLNDQSS